MASHNAEILDRVIKKLVDDYHRRGGYVSSDHVLRAIEKGDLDVEDHIAIRSELERRGVEIDEPGSDRETELPSEASALPNRDLVRRYLTEIGSIKLLQPKEEIVLARRIEAGKQAAEIVAHGSVSKNVSPRLHKLVREGREAGQRMVVSNLRLVVNIAKRYVGRSDLDLLDLIQEGTFGLIKAVEKFQHQKGFKFSTYATWWIEQRVTRALADRGRLIRLPVHVHESRLRIFKIRKALRNEYQGREPTIAEIAEQLGWHPVKVQFLTDIGNQPLSLDTPIGDDKETLSNFLKSSLDRNPENETLALERSRAIMSALDSLKPRERAVLARRFGLGGHSPETLEQIGQSLNVTRERIRQIEFIALEKLRHLSRSPKLKVFWY